ncbi:MAG: alanine racemase, partial [Bifidobacterium psychraerophilum]
MTLNAAPRLEFSSELGESNYKRACREYPGQVLVDLAVMKRNMEHLVDVCGGAHSGTAVMGVVKADAY